LTKNPAAHDFVLRQNIVSMPSQKHQMSVINLKAWQLASRKSHDWTIAFFNAPDYTSGQNEKEKKLGNALNNHRKCI